MTASLSASIGQKELALVFDTGQETILVATVLVGLGVAILVVAAVKSGRPGPSLSFLLALLMRVPL